jgi:predicted nucleic acid-binding protein
VKVALDTNILAYAEGVNGVEMKEKALDLVQQLPAGSVVLPTQVLGELFNVLVLKAKKSPTSARTAILTWRDTYASSDTSAAVIVKAVDLAADHKLRIWDSVILAATAEAGCRLLLSEDLQEGFTWQGVTVANPFSATPHPLLDALLGRSES